jgi:hypothetical protein
LLPVLFTLTQVVLLLITSTFARVQIQSNLGTTAVLFICAVQLAIPKLVKGLGTSVKKCPNWEMNQIAKKITSKLVSIQSLKTFT